MKTLSFILFASLLFVVSRCYTCPDAEMVSGKYIYSHNGITSTADSIHILVDGTYIRKVQSNDGSTFICNGNWKLNESNCQILFKDFDNAQGGLPPGNWFSRLRLVKAEVRLMYSAEDNIYYSKTKNYH